MYPSAQSSWNSDNKITYQDRSNLEESLYNDPVRTARDQWVARHTNISDSSEIIDSIEVDMIDATEDMNATEIYLVIDTNVLIRHLLVLKQALARINADVTRLNVVMLVPGIVVSELDYQKDSARGIANESRRASSWLAAEIGSGTSRIKGQAYTQTMLPSGDWRQRSGLSNDELILDCCKYFAQVKRKDVLLCTSDNNLAVQAFANVMNLFVRGVSAVIRPPAQLWDCGKLLECVVPAFGKSIAASTHAFDSSRGTYSQSSTVVNSSATSTVSSSAPHSVYHIEDHGVMEVDADGDRAILSNSLQFISPKDRRDVLHRQLAEELGQQLRKLTGMAAKLQQYRRGRESMYSPSNARFSGTLPTESDWSCVWPLRDCLKFLAKIPPPQQRSWIFGDGEASSLADFLGLPGEKGARPGREWAKHDWGRELLVVTNLAKDFEFEDLNHSKMVEYEHAVIQVFAID